MEYILKLANLYEGKLLIGGFGSGTHPNEILSEMKSGNLIKRDFIIADSFTRKPPQPAYDFLHKVNNEIKHKCELIKESKTNLDSFGKIAIFYFDIPQKAELADTLKFYSKYSTNPCLVICKTRQNPQLADTVLSFTTKLSTSPVKTEGNFSYFKHKLDSITTKVTRSQSVLT